MESNEKGKESMLDKKRLQEILKSSKLKESDLEKLKEGRLDDISEEAKEVLKNFETTAETIKETSIESPEGTKDVVAKDHDVKKPRTSQKPFKENVKECDVALVPREEIEKFLRGRSISESLITTLLKVGFTDEFLRLLKSMEFDDEDIAELERLWDLETKNREEVDSLASSSSDECLSPDGFYLKTSLSEPLSRGIREIVAKKPFDPIEYLGHWLLNYKICEERSKRQREFELELMIERERLKPRDEEDEIPMSASREEEEDYGDDWNFLDYE